MPNLTFATKGAAEVIAQQEKLNKAAEKGAAAYHDTTRAAKEAGDQIQKNSRTGERAQDRVTDSVRKTGTEYRRMSSEQRRQARTAEAIMKRNETAQERYNRLVKEARTALTGTKNASETYRREVDLLNREMQESTGRFRGFANEHNTAFGSTAVEQIKSYVLGVGSVVSILGTVQRAISGVVEETLQVQEFSRQGKGGVGLLRQLTGDQTEYNKLTGLAREFVSSGAAPDLDAGARAVFSLASAGLLDESGLFQQLGGKGVVADTETLARAVKTQLASFGRGETGNARAILSKAFTASGYSPATVEQLLESASLSAGSAKAFGLTDEENLAAIALLATSTGSASRAGTALSSFIPKVDQSGQFQGKNLSQVVRDIAGRNLGAEELQKLLGDKEAILAFRNLAENIALLDEVNKAIDASQTNPSVIADRLNLRDPATDAARQLDIERNRSKIALESEASFRTLMETFDERRNRQDGPFIRSMNRLFEGMVGGVTNPRSVLSAEFQANTLSQAERQTYLQLLAQAQSEGELTQGERNVLRGLSEQDRDIFRGMLEAQRAMLEAQNETNRKLDDSGLVGVSE